MAQDQTKKEALFNEVKGSLFEFLVAKKLAVRSQKELEFVQSLDKNYLSVLSQQDRMVRQFYPEMLPFLEDVSTKTVNTLIDYLKEIPTAPKLLGKFVNSSLKDELHEADLLIETQKESLPISLKLNKKNAFVNTKSGGIKSFFTQYFSFLPNSYQEKFNQFVDQEFIRMAVELHELNEMEFSGDFSHWVKRDKSELPGELNPEERGILKNYYSRIAKEVHRILTAAAAENKDLFNQGLCPLMGFGSKEIVQVVCFHDFKSMGESQVSVHPYSEVSEQLLKAEILPFHDIASVEVKIGHWTLQIRVKPMNKFTTTAIKMNCSVKVQN